MGALRHEKETVDEYDVILAPARKVPPEVLSERFWWVLS